ncbi:unnamed protein product [Pocillopora meandrina]|uniref:Uncharacterized protein n=1 Tax=Pocillopora meandrina TaxID=46732 RepID=A0AAU9W4K5_9CNID|nr:unnamed protein product [Pocillopora meandrina]
MRGTWLSWNHKPINLRSFRRVAKHPEPLSLDAAGAATSGAGRCHTCYTASEKSSGDRRKLHRDSDWYTAYGCAAKYNFPSKNRKSPTS